MHMWKLVVAVVVLVCATIEKDSIVNDTLSD